MRGRIAIALLSVACLGMGTAQQDTPAAGTQGTTTTSQPADSKSSALLAAAKKGKTARAKKPKVITNADVKKAKGKVVVLPPKEPLPEEASPKKGLSADDAYRERRKANERVAAAEKAVAELERELVRLEQNFYDANDPNYRDDVIQKRFEQTKQQLDGARKNLADARDALAATGGQTR
ncbi:MAG TPA: hypothetical protein VFL80_04150 [Thermoanaerobaculia bacterium]|nr:hypothetical protein [Thermoanaerobaculia bacterium]